MRTAFSGMIALNQYRVHLAKGPIGDTVQTLCDFGDSGSGDNVMVVTL